MQSNSALLQSFISKSHVPHAQGWVGSCMDTLEKKALKFVSDLFAKEGNPSHQEKLLAHNHPDYLIFEPSSKTGQYTIEQIRLISDKSQLFPHEASYQFFVLKFSERMQVAAANAFLKTLEEPADKTYFIFLIHHLEDLLPTLRSRLQILSFEEEKEVDTSKNIELLDQLLQKLPNFSYNELYLTCQSIQENFEKGESKEVNMNETIELEKQMDALFIHLEKWYFSLKRRAPYSFKFFQKRLEKARLGVQRAIKISTALEYLLLSLQKSL